MSTPRFQRVAVVNRGEAAVRFIRAARCWSRENDQSLTVVAMYTTPERDAPFVRMASGAVDLGEPLVPGPEGRPRSAYLDIERVLELAKGAGADAVWPGWGFVAESPDFADACRDKGIVFLGPSGQVMRDMGDKIAAKRIAEEEDVPVSPWSQGPLTSVADARTHARRIGFPVLLKATAGGGGRGIRLVGSPDELEEAFKSADAEAGSAFGNATLFMEAFVPKARHVEVQILGDEHGNFWALGTRDCSLQRRNQKVIEEAPAPGIADEIREKMEHCAVQLARRVRYTGVGTVEYLLLPDNETFYFLEMNTRLQVEHTVTEEVYGFDLVQAQINVAMGRPLPGPTPPSPRGAAIEARLNAEEPDEGFAPRIGRIVRFSPGQGPGVRIDSGFALGNVVPSAFDSNIAKIIAWGADRRQAVARLQTALRDTLVALESGLTNRSLLLELVSETEFREAPTYTRWLGPYLEQRPEPEERRYLGVALAAAAIGDHERARAGMLANFLEEAQRGLPRSAPDPEPSTYRYRIGMRGVTVTVYGLAAGQFRVVIGPWTATVKYRQMGDHTYLLELNGMRHTVLQVATATVVHIDVEGVAHHFERKSDGRVRAPLPASVSQVHVKVDDHIEAGERLVTLEVMKMETSLVSPLSGRVRAVHVLPAGQVLAGDVLVELEEAASHSESAAPADVELPARDEPDPHPVAVLQARLLGYEVDAAQVAEAAKQVGERGTRQQLLDLLRLAVVQDQLFKSGPFDDAKNEAQESTLEQLTWFIHHRRRDATALSARFLRRIGRFLELHGVTEDSPVPRVEDALLRLFQSRRLQAEIDAHMLTIVKALAGQPVDAHSTTEPRVQRVIFEKLANAAVQRRANLLATAAWNLIYRWYDLPDHREAMGRLLHEADEAVAILVKPGYGPDERAEAHARLLRVPIETLVHTVPRAVEWSPGPPQALLRLLMERVYGSQDQEPLGGMPPNVAARRVWRAHNEWAAGVVVPVPTELTAIISALPRGVPVDLFLAFEPSDELMQSVAGSLGDCPALTFLWPKSSELMDVRTYIVEGGSAREEALLKHFHSARPVAQQVKRLSNFALERFSAPGILFAARASAPEEERLVVMAEIEQFDPIIEETYVRVPAFEKVYLDAVEVLRDYRRTRQGEPVWNRISIVVGRVVDLTEEQMERLAERLSPPTLDLGLEKVELHGRFSFGRANPPEELVAEWSNPVGLGVSVSYHKPRHRPMPTRSRYEQQVLVARRRGLFYPYEVIKRLVALEGDRAVNEGRFEEFDLDAEGKLASVADRPYGHNQANVVVGVITNWTTRFPDGLTRVLIVGDPTRRMGALAEPECRRINEAIDMAERQRLPVEWVALSAGAAIEFDSGTENLDWTAAVLRRIVEFTAAGGVINVIVDGGCVGAQSYWNAEATMLMHCKGALIMTPRGYMVLTGKKALEYAGSVAGASNEAIGGLDIMEPNGEIHYAAPDLNRAFEVLFRHYDVTYVPPKERYTRRVDTSDPVHRDVSTSPYTGAGDFKQLGDIVQESTNPGRKKPFAIRPVMTAVMDQEVQPLERWPNLVDGETAVVLLGQLGGQPITMIGIESTPIKRKGTRPIDGPDSWMSGTLFPQSSRKVARALRTASGVHPVVVLANLSGFDGSPESLRNRQLEYGAEIGKAVVEFEGPIIFCVVARYHGGAYVVFSQRLNDRLEASALAGSYASVIGGAPAAQVVFPRLVRKRTMAREDVQAALRALENATPEDQLRSREQFEEVFRNAEAAVQAEVAREFDTVHSVERAKEVGSLNAILNPSQLRPFLCERVQLAVEDYRGLTVTSAPSSSDLIPAQ